MYTVIVVDDEELIVTGLKNMIERIGSPKIREVITADGGQQALIAARKFKPNILFTDIRMPGMDGLALIKALKKINPNVKIVVLSGYDEFDYVKAAFKMGISDYLLKPARISKVKNALETVFREIDSDNREQERFAGKGDEERRIDLENCLKRLTVSDDMKESEIEGVFSRYHISFTYDAFCLGIVSAKTGTPAIRPENLHELAQAAAEEILDSKEAIIYCFFDSRRNSVLLINHAGIKQGLLLEFFQRLNSLLKNHLDIPYYFSVSSPETGKSSLAELYRQADYALRSRILFGHSCVIMYCDAVNRAGNTASLEKQLNLLSYYMPNFIYDRIGEILDNIFSAETIQNQSVENVTRLYRGVLNQLEASVRNRSIDIGAGIFKDFSEFDQLSDLRIYLKECVLKYASMIKEADKNKSAIDIVKEYVKSNYHKDIDMSMAANQVSMCYTYFSKLFKEKTGVNFIEYITQVRMEEARKLLDKQVYKINEIAGMVGYDNPKRFTRLFRSYFGVLPNEYKGK